MRRQLSILAHERTVLIDLYNARRIPVDQYEDRPESLVELTEEWNRLTNRTDSSARLHHYMRSQRKLGKWVKLDDPLPPPEKAKLSAEEIEILISIFTENVTAIEHGSDTLAYDPNVAAFIAREFADRTGRVVPPSQLVAKLTAIRKRGLLPRVGDNKKDDEGFEDLQQAQA